EEGVDRDANREQDERNPDQSGRDEPHQDDGEDHPGDRDRDLSSEVTRDARMLPFEEDRREARRKVDEREQEDGRVDQVGQAAEEARDVRRDAQDGQAEVRGVEPLLLATEQMWEEAVYRH